MAESPLSIRCHAHRSDSLPRARGLIVSPHQQLRDSAVRDCVVPLGEGETIMTAVHKTLLAAGAAAFALSLSGCNKSAGAADASAVQTAIKADEKTWNDQFKSKDLEGLLSHYADD